MHFGTKPRKPPSSPSQTLVHFLADSVLSENAILLLFVLMPSLPNEVCTTQIAVCHVVRYHRDSVLHCKGSGCNSQRGVLGEGNGFRGSALISGRV